MISPHFIMRESQVGYPGNTYPPLNQLLWLIWCDWTISTSLNSLRPRQNGRHFADDVLKCIFLNENVWISLKISLTFAPKGPINNIPALVQIMAWRRPGDKPLSEAMMVSLLTHICVTRPQWVKYSNMEFYVKLHTTSFLYCAYDYLYNEDNQRRYLVLSRYWLEISHHCYPIRI